MARDGTPAEIARGDETKGIRFHQQDASATTAGPNSRNQRRPLHLKLEMNVPRDGSDIPRPERPEPRQITPDQVRLEYANQQIMLVHARERDMAVEIVARDAALAELRQAGETKDGRIAELEAQLSGMCAELAAKDARIAELEAAPFYASAEITEPVGEPS